MHGSGLLQMSPALKFILQDIHYQCKCKCNPYKYECSYQGLSGPSSHITARGVSAVSYYRGEGGVGMTFESLWTNIRKLITDAL